MILFVGHPKNKTAERSNPWNLGKTKQTSLGTLIGKLTPSPILAYAAFS